MARGAIDLPGKLLDYVVAVGARRCIEIGTYTGYSTLAVALALKR